MVVMSTRNIPEFFYIIYFKRTKIINKKTLSTQTMGYDYIDFSKNPFPLKDFCNKYLVDQTPYNPPPYKEGDWRPM